MVRQAERRAATVGAILAAARKRFAVSGFDATTIDDIAAAAHVAKGAVYHHFRSKEEIFERLLDSIQAEIAAQLPAAARSGKDPVDRMYRATLKYLTAATAPEVRRILLIDGPAVLGWNKWREIDQKYFCSLTPLPEADTAKTGLTAREMQAIVHLLTGAITEAALVCATADNPEKKARELAAGLRILIGGLVRQA